MCGRYSLLVKPKQLSEIFDVPLFDFQANANIKPSDPAPIIFGGTPRVTLANWWFRRAGMTEAQAKSFSAFNAVSERIASSRLYSHAFQSQRCLVPCSQIIEWHHYQDGTKQPYSIEIGDQDICSLAGVYEEYAPGEFSFAILTTAANPLMAQIHNTKARQPVVVLREDRAAWLAGETPNSRLNQICETLPETFFRAVKLETVTSPEPKVSDQASLFG
jgi:putative SOS response-associated peptidase YedK